ncbi:hypothetical protein HDU67_006909, partial [Dinochytrium kinnereticum]
MTTRPLRLALLAGVAAALASAFAKLASSTTPHALRNPLYASLCHLILPPIPTDLSPHVMNPCVEGVDPPKVVSGADEGLMEGVWRGWKVYGR